MQELGEGAPHRIFKEAIFGKKQGIFGPKNDIRASIGDIIIWVRDLSPPPPKKKKNTHEAMVP